MAQLILQDGSSFTGKLFGARKRTDGEVVFNTGMVGYPQSLTDPSYRGQILTFTYPLIGNYGVPGNEKDRHGIPLHFESDQIHVRGVVVSQESEEAFHWEKKETLDSWLRDKGVTGISGIDTRALTQKLRAYGVMLGQIVPDGEKPVKKINDPNAVNLVAEVSIKKPVTYRPGKRTNGTMVVLDCGMKNNILRSLLERGITVIRVPWDYDFFELKEKFDGIFITNGPGDPQMAGAAYEHIKEALKRQIPTFGICLGVQILALAAGGATYKLKYGHRAQNQPVTDMETGSCFLTSQNHGYTVDEKKLPHGWDVWMRNTNDNTVEGIKHSKKPFMAVQFHPEADPGPTDSAWIFDTFISHL